MAEQMTPGTRVRHVDGYLGVVAELEAWDEDPPAGETSGERTRVEWDTGIREWVHTEDLVAVPDDRNEHQ